MTGEQPIQVPFGEGFRCVGGSIFRLNPASLANGNGHSQRSLDYANPPQPAGQIGPGSTWNFQAWYRDNVGGMTTSNFTDAIALTFF